MYPVSKLFLCWLLAVASGGWPLLAQCIDGDCQNGQGLYRYESGASFEGRFSGGQLASGTYTYASGAVYSGDFENNLRHGQGIYIGSSGKKFVGEFQAGEMVFGTMTYTNGVVYTGQFRGGRFHGLGRIRTTDGEVREGRWAQGQLVEEGPSRPATAGSSNPERIYALCVGVADYIYFGPQSGDLNFCNSDAERFDIFLRSGKVSHGNPALVTSLVLTDEQATKANIIREMNRLYAMADENDKVIFFFSGHGDRSVFLPADTQSGRPGSLLQHSEVKRAFKQSRAGIKLIFADACYSGSIQQPTATTPGSSGTASSGNSQADVAVMLSSTGSQISFEHPSLRQGVFAYFLIEGMGGQADKNRDRSVSIEELFYYVHAKSTQFTRTNFGREQTPYLFGRFDRDMNIADLR